MKQAISILLVALIFLQPYSKIWIVVSFKINQDKIAKTLCVKKEIKNNTCQGKCHLKKQLEKAGKEGQEQAPTNQKGKNKVRYCNYSKPYNFLKSIDFQLNKLNIAFSKNFHTSSFIKDIFHPPELHLI